MKESSGIILAPLGALYSAVTRARRALYKTGALKVHKIVAPVISIGNITTGGTGKTPLVEWSARALAREGLRACVLTRGYGRADVFVLDDGFQHLRIARDLDIVTLDATAPWGGGRLLPRGRLREPPAALARAGCVVITRAELAGDLENLRAEAVRLSGGRAAVISSRVRTRALSPLNAASDSPNAEHEGRSVASPAAAFCAVGNPRAFFEHLRRDGLELRHARAFPDHHAFTQKDVEEVAREAARRGARALLTTAKDAVKLRGFDFPLPCYVVETELEFEDEGRLLGLIREALSR